jgi:hypothetical protein
MLAWKAWPSSPSSPPHRPIPSNSIAIQHAWLVGAAAHHEQCVSRVVEQCDAHNRRRSSLSASDQASAKRATVLARTMVYRSNTDKHTRANYKRQRTTNRPVVVVVVVEQKRHHQHHKALCNKCDTQAAQAANIRRKQSAPLEIARDVVVQWQ